MAEPSSILPSPTKAEKGSLVGPPMESPTGYIDLTASQSPNESPSRTSRGPSRSWSSTSELTGSSRSDRTKLSAYSFDYVPSVERLRRRTSSEEYTIVRPDWFLDDDEDPTIAKLFRRIPIKPKHQFQILAQIIVCKYSIKQVQAAQLNAYFKRNYDLHIPTSFVSLVSERLDWLKKEHPRAWQDVVSFAASHFTAMEDEDKNELYQAWVECSVADFEDEGWGCDWTKVWEMPKSGKSKRKGTGKARETVAGITEGAAEGSSAAAVEARSEDKMAVDAEAVEEKAAVKAEPEGGEAAVEVMLD